MLRINGVRRLFQIQRNRAGIERAVDDELRFHFEMTVRDLMSNGMDPDGARREAERRFGDVKLTRERLASIDESRAVRDRRAEWWSGFAQDVRYALRGLRRKPGFAIAVVATLGLGIGANATMFGIVDRLLFRPPNYLIAPDRASRLYLITSFRGKEGVRSSMGYRRFLDLQTETKSFEVMTPFYSRKLVVGTGDATRETLLAVSGPGLWKMFDVKPVIGRFFGEADNDVKNPSNVVVLSYAFWLTQFGGRTTVLDSAIDIGARKYTVIGVAPEGFAGFSGEPFAGFLPIAAAAVGMSGDPKNPWYETYGMTWFETFGRRKPGITSQVATADLTHAFELSYKKELAWRPSRTPFEIAKPHALSGPVLRDRGPTAGNEAKVATWLGGVAAVVLLIACANVANLLLARALRRRREIAVRIALGVSRGRLAMQLLTESLILAILGGVAGLAIAQWGGGVMRRALLDQASGPSAFSDPRLLMFAGLLVAVAGLLTGLAPIFQVGREDVAVALKTGSREGIVQRSRLRGSLLVAQAAFSVVLLVGAGLFLRSMNNVRNIPFGYDADRLLWVDINWRGMKVDRSEEIQKRQQLFDRAIALPGVEHASRALTVPFYMTWQPDLYVPGIDSVSKLGDFTMQAGSPDFFQTMGTHILRGRGITAEDQATTNRVMVVSETMAKKLWPNQDPIGKLIKVNSDTMPWTTVVGVAQDVRRGSLTEPEAHYYLPIDQFRPNEGGVFVRTRGRASAQVDQVRRELQRLMPGVAYVTVTPMSTIMSYSTRSWKLGATMFTVFGALALVLAAIGLYSVIAYNVTQRTHEMGVRVALGAEARDVIQLVVGEGLRVVIPGVALGALIALAGGKWIAPLLFQVTPTDPPVMVSVVVTLVTVAVLASWLPATRASRVDPNEALRSD
jgi:putative ABC transport system permease protein